MNVANRGPISLLLATVAFVIPAANAQDRDRDWNVGLSGTDNSAEVLSQEPPEYPGARVRRGQEGWARMAYVIAPSGSATDPLIIDSSGGQAFEDMAREVTGDWRFAPLDTAVERPDNLVNIRWEIEKGRDKATSNFMRRYIRIVTHLRAEEYEEARSRVDSAHKIGGWNLYESTMLWLMTGRVEGAEGNLAGKLECYRRAHRLSEKIRLKREDRVELLEKIFELEYRFGQYAEALGTYAQLETFLGKDAMNEEIEAFSAELRAKIDGNDAITAQATIYNPCDCEAGVPLWYYNPARRTFSFANLSGNVESFEARCEYHRVQGPVEAGTEWTLAPEWGSCRVFVFGDDGATFEFVEHPTDAGDDAPTAVARDDVLDSRNRGERG